MAKFEVKLTRVFGACFVNTVTIEAEDKYEAKELAKDTDWSKSLTEMSADNLSDAYKFAEITVDGVPIEQTMFGDDLLNEAVEFQKLIEQAKKEQG